MNVASFVSGGVMVGSLIVSMMFLKFWSSTQDRFFSIFSFAFFTMAIERVVLLFHDEGPGAEENAPIYLLRLVAFVLILIAIIDKNRGPDRRDS
jgi:hypothetical protein